MLPTLKQKLDNITQSFGLTGTGSIVRMNINLLGDCRQIFHKLVEYRRRKRDNNTTNVDLNVFLLLLVKS